MLTVDQYEYIRIAHRVYGKTIREIARETGHSRNTVKKVLNNEHIEYSPRQNQSYPSLGLYLPIIDKWLQDDKDQPKKQRHTGTRIYNRLASAEAVLRLRAPRSSNDFDKYWDFHEACKYKRNHQTFYADGEVPPTKLPQSSSKGGHLRVIK